jgi:UDP-glucuronate 4-epimerase
MTVLVTGAAGFIGYHTTTALLRAGRPVIGLDNLNEYYDPGLKAARLALLQEHPRFRFAQIDVADRTAMGSLMAQAPEITEIIHLAAQAGVRYSLIDPYAYVHSNVLGHLTVIEAARQLPRLRHLVYASSSSIYGDSAEVPFRESDRADTPVSMYAATKRADELISRVYGHIYALPQSGLRFFTVYGPWGRPDMAYYSFARAICAGEAITVYGDGRLQRDFTYIDDVVAGILGVLQHPPTSAVPARILNLGNNHAETVLTLVGLLEASLGRRAIIQFAPRQVADVGVTFAAIDAIQALTGFQPSTSLAVGIPRFVAWFKTWHGIDAPITA